MPANQSYFVNTTPVPLTKEELDKLCETHGHHAVRVDGRCVRCGVEFEAASIPDALLAGPATILRSGRTRITEEGSS